MIPLHATTEAILPTVTPAPLSDYAESEPEIEDENPNTEEESNEQEQQEEPTQDDIEAWMSPEKARKKQLLLTGQYRLAGRLRQQLQASRDMGEKWRAQNTRLRAKSKCEKMRRLAAEKTMNDILKMLEQ